MTTAPLLDVADGATYAGDPAGVAAVLRDDAPALSTLREATGSNVPLLGADPTVATRRTILGALLFTLFAVPAGVVFGLRADRVMVVMRDDVRLEVSREAYFSSDRVAVKVTMRVGFAFAHPAAVVKVAMTV